MPKNLCVEPLIEYYFLYSILQQNISKRRKKKNIKWNLSLCVENTNNSPGFLSSYKKNVFKERYTKMCGKPNWKKVSVSESNSFTFE